MTISFIYGLHASDAPHEFVYVGRTIAPARRLKQHRGDRKTLVKWIAAVRARGGTVDMHIFDSVPAASKSKSERFAIEALRALSYPLLNQTHGGGSHGFVMSDAARAKISRARKGMTFTAEHREKIGAAHRGQKRGSRCRDAVERTAAAQRGVPKTPEHRAALSAGQLRRFARERLNRLAQGRP